MEVSASQPAYQAIARGPSGPVVVLELAPLPVVWTEPVALEAAAEAELVELTLTEQAGAAQAEVVRDRQARRVKGNMCNMLKGGKFEVRE